MGMAASQARYLSLSARKTNTEYEGQQLNQQRLNLANQSADLFNQMLTMSVPTCPDSNDFTTLQYAWSDGINDEVISDYYQIATPNEEFNYVVTSYHYENVYTGQSKKMNAPEIQATHTNHFTKNLTKHTMLTSQHITRNLNRVQVTIHTPWWLKEMVLLQPTYLKERILKMILMLLKKLMH